MTGSFAARLGHQEPFVRECDLTLLKGSRDIQIGMLVDRGFTIASIVS